MWAVLSGTSIDGKFEFCALLLRFYRKLKIRSTVGTSTIEYLRVAQGATKTVIENFYRIDLILFLDL
jgi:hypothetical protein